MSCAANLTARAEALAPGRFPWGVLLTGIVIGMVLGISEMLWLARLVGWRLP